MPLDGTYGRLSAHNQRFKELRRKKLERREQKLWRNSLKDTHHGKMGAEHHTNNLSPEKLEELKGEIRKKAKAELKQERYLFIAILLIVSLLAYFLFFY